MQVPIAIGSELGSDGLYRQSIYNNKARIMPRLCKSILARIMVAEEFDNDNAIVISLMAHSRACA